MNNISYRNFLPSTICSITLDPAGPGTPDGPLSPFGPLGPFKGKT